MTYSYQPSFKKKEKPGFNKAIEDEDRYWLYWLILAMKLKASYVMHVTFCSIKLMCMSIKRKKTNTFWKVVLLFIIKKENQIGNYLLEYNVKHTIKMFENV